MAWIFFFLEGGGICAMNSALTQTHCSTWPVLTEAGCAKPKKDGALLKSCRAVVSMEWKVKPNRVCFLHKSLKSLLLRSWQRAASICQRTTFQKGHCKSQERNNKTRLFYCCAILCSSPPLLLQKQMSCVGHNTRIPTKVCSLPSLDYNLFTPVQSCSKTCSEQSL